MTDNKSKLSAQLRALRTTDLSPFIRMSNVMAPRMLGVFLPKLDEKQRKAFDKAMPLGGGKRFYLHLVGTPTPPIVIEMGQPLKMSTMAQSQVKQEGIQGMRLSIDDLKVILERRIISILWRLKGQVGAILSLSGTFFPFLLLGPRELKDMQQKAKTHFKPLLDMMPH